MGRRRPASSTSPVPLGISHAAVYRHFPSKDALFDAVAGRWLHAVSQPLTEIAARRGKPAKRLEDWLTTLIAIKRRKVTDDPELFATYHAVAEARAQGRVRATSPDCWIKLRRIIADGMASGDFSRVGRREPRRTAVLNATRAFSSSSFRARISGRPGCRSAPLSASSWRVWPTAMSRAQPVHAPTQTR